MTQMWKIYTRFLPTPQSRLDHWTFLHYRLWHVERGSFLQATRWIPPQCHRILSQRVVVIVHSRQLNVGIVVGCNHRLLRCGRKLMVTVCVGVVGIIRGEFTGNVLDAELLWWLVVKWRLFFDAFCGENLNLDEFWNDSWTYGCFPSPQSSILTRMFRSEDQVSEKKGKIYSQSLKSLSADFTINTSSSPTCASS